MKLAKDDREIDAGRERRKLAPKVKLFGESVSVRERESSWRTQHQQRAA